MPCYTGLRRSSQSDPTTTLPRNGGGRVRSESFLADARGCLRAWWRVCGLCRLRLVEHLPAFIERDQLDRAQIPQRPGTTNRNGERRRGGIVGHLDNPQEVVIAEAPVERFKLATQPRENFRDSCGSVPGVVDHL